MGEVVPFPGPSGVRRCRCGWACPRDLAFSLRVAPALESQAADYDVEVTFACPACGWQFAVTWSDARIVDG